MKCSVNRSPHDDWEAMGPAEPNTSKEDVACASRALADLRGIAKTWASAPDRVKAAIRKAAEEVEEFLEWAKE